MPLTPEQRRLRAQIAANTRWARENDRTLQTARARAAALERFEREVDPNNELPLDERLHRAENAFKAHMCRMALASSKARSGRASRTDGAA
jgi:hypothetical protein